MFSLSGRYISLLSKSSFELVRLRLAEQNASLLLASPHRRRWRWRRRQLLLLVAMVMMMMMMMWVGGADELLTVTVALWLLVDDVIVCDVNLRRLRTHICNSINTRLTPLNCFTCAWCGSLYIWGITYVIVNFYDSAWRCSRFSRVEVVLNSICLFTLARTVTFTSAVHFFNFFDNALRHTCSSVVFICSIDLQLV